MRRIQTKNINTPGYWNGVFSKGDYSRPSQDTTKVVDVSNHIELGKSVIDLGCGLGHFLSYIKNNRVCDCTGVDYSAYQIRTLQNKYPSIKWICADVTDTKIKDEFDYVLSFETLEHLDNPEDLVAEMARLTKQNGKALLTTPYQNRIPSSEHVWQFTYKDLEKMFYKYYRWIWVSPWASGARVENTKTKDIIYPCGNWDTILVKAIK